MGAVHSLKRIIRRCIGECPHILTFPCAGMIDSPSTRACMIDWQVWAWGWWRANWAGLIGRTASSLSKR